MRSNITRAAIALAALGLLWLLAAATAYGDVRYAVFGVVVALSPLLVWLSLRYPILFPFGVYLAFVPIDPLLTVSEGGGTLTRFAGIAAIAALALRALLLRRAVVPPRSWFGWLAVILYASFSLVWSLNVEHTQALLSQMLSLFALFTALATYPIEYFELLWIRRLLISIGIATAVYGNYAFQNGNNSGLHQKLGRLWISVGHMRFDPNHYAAFFVIPIAIVVVGFLCDTRPRHKAAYAMIFAFLATNVLLSGSRGALVSVAVVIFYLGIRTRKFVPMMAIATAGLGLSFLIPNVWARFADKTQGEGSGRNEIWLTGLHALREYWLAGSGFGTYPDAYDNYVLQSSQHIFVGLHRPSHSLILESAVEFGVLGSIVLLFALWSSLRQNVTIPREHPLFTFRLEAEGMLVGVLFVGLTIDILWFKYFWLALSYGVLLANVHRSRSLVANARTSAIPRPAARMLGGTKSRTVPNARF